jgi:REP element-mobilizing transposase RayT
MARIDDLMSKENPVPDLPNRRSIRLPGYDYAGPGSLFFTWCTQDRFDFFGSVVDAEMRLNPVGELVWREWNRTLEIRKELLAHAFIVMPNHLHGLISFAPVEGTVSPLPEPGADLPLHARKRPRSLSSMATGFKSAVTSVMRKRTGNDRLDIWQRNYYEHIVRDARDFDSIYAYILENPKRWEEDRFNPHRRK